MQESSNGTYSKCTRYDVNWTQLLQEEDYDIDELFANTSWSTVGCNQGWEFDTSQVSSSIVIDVRKHFALSITKVFL